MSIQVRRLAAPGAMALPAVTAVPDDTPRVARLFDRHGALAWTVALRLTADAARAEDVVCAAFVELARSIDRVADAEIDRRWIVRAVANAALDSTRKRLGASEPGEDQARSR
jgi:RNA polymerase sigma-70 factor (ECF subfamily)